jgi:biopolymer transport protein ExbD
MARRHHYRRRVKPPMELDVTTFLNLMVVLVPFLLITAVFSRITIVELNLPSASGGPQQDPPAFRVEVIVREDGLEIGNGTQPIAAIPNVGGDYDLATLSDHMVALKRQYSEIDTASVLLEPQIPYDYLIRVMDTVRSVEVAGGNGDEVEEGEPMYAALFPNVSIGEAP